MSSQMSSISSLPPGRSESSRIASAPTWPLWRGVSSTRNCASRLVSCRISPPPVVDSASPQVSYPAVSASSRGANQGLGADLGDRPAACEAHGEVKVRDEVADDLANARLAARREPPQVRPTDADRRRAQGKRLEHVGAAAHAAVKEHRYPPIDRFRDRGQRLDRGDRAVHLAAAVV